ncbi:MAG: hypothetical protein AAF594_14005 [Bacteroidota bacterium]
MVADGSAGTSLNAEAVERWFWASAFGDGTDAARRRARRALRALDAGAFAGLDADVRAGVRQRLFSLVHLHPPSDARPGTS